MLIEDHKRVSYCRIFPGVWEGVTEWLSASLERFGSGWEADCSLGIPNEAREQWNTRKVFPTRDEAARFAADFVLVAEGIVESVVRGVEPWTPHRAMALECANALDTDPKLLELAAAAERAEWPSRGQLRLQLRSARMNAESDWYRSHDWRDFRRPTSMKGAA